MLKRLWAMVTAALPAQTKQKPARATSAGNEEAAHPAPRPGSRLRRTSPVAAQVTVMNRHTTGRAVGLALALTLPLCSADRAFAAGMQCDGCFAFVDAGGNVGRSRGVVSATQLEEGRYEVAFTEPVTKCAFTAPIGVTVSTSPNIARPAMVAATGDGANEASTGVIVQTFNSSGVLSNQSFFVFLTCLPN
jgi:hypothetical protein